MGFNPTPNQRAAIETIDRHVAVTAGAGSGKTRVLVERYLNLLDQGTPIEKIAAITFTKKAAQEMRERLQKARPALIQELTRAQISTIHSLCQRIIQEHPLEAAIDPRFRIGEEWETQALLDQVIEDILEGQDLPDEFNSKSQAKDLIWELYREMLTKGERNFEAPNATLEFGSTDIFVAPLCHEVEQFLTVTPDTQIQRETMEELREDWARIKELLTFPDPDFQLEALASLNEFIKRIRGKLADYTVVIKELIGQGTEAIYAQKGAELTYWLSHVLADVHANYNQTKEDLGILDFNDLEFLAHKLLQLDHVRELYNFTHLMVDEFQDTNPIQKKIVDALVEQGALLFVVGDPKQSIYRFRGADVSVFVETKGEIGETGKNIFLAENFRSRPELIEFTNHLFPQIMHRGDIVFEGSTAWRERANRPCVTLLRTPADGLNLEEGRTKEAEQIALQIRSLVDAGGYKYEDISLLFRAMTNVRIYERALQEANIPYVNLSGRGFYAQQEIRDILHYFSWLEDEGNLVSKLAVLRSPFYLISDQALYWLKQGEEQQLTEAEQGRLEQAKQDYIYLKNLIKHEKAPVVIATMLERTNYLATTWKLPFGPQKVANVEKLLEQSWQLFAQDLVSVPEQLRYIHLMSKDTKGEGEALLDAEHADVVKILTIHGAKGLEFPVVFLPDTSGSISRSQRGKVLYHPDLGLTYANTRPFETLKELENQAAYHELERLLYVAVTRARDELYWCSLADGKNRTSWWKWLETALPEIPKHLYRELSAVQADFTKQTSESLQSKLELPKYKPLQPQYNQVVFSVTSILNYEFCPRYYYLRYILRLPELGVNRGSNGSNTPSVGLTALQRGNIVHRVVEQIRDSQDLERLVDYAAAMEGIQLEKSQNHDLQQIIKPYLQSEFFARVLGTDWEVHHERDFNVPADEFLINGLVDQVFVSPHGIEIVDFKSNWIKQEQVQEVGTSYDVQLRLYAWAMAKEFNLPVLKSQAYFLIPNQIYQLDRELLNPSLTEAWVANICRTIIQGAEIGVEAFPPKLNCANCAQSSYCGNCSSFGENTDDQTTWIEEELV